MYEVIIRHTLQPVKNERHYEKKMHLLFLGTQENVMKWLLLLMLLGIVRMAAGECSGFEVECPDKSCVYKYDPCPGQRCPQLHFECKNGDCVSGVARQHCPDGMCNRTFERQCEDGSCGFNVQYACKEDGCPDYQPVQCGDGTCLLEYFRCNQKADCNDGADEPWDCAYKRPVNIRIIKLVTCAVLFVLLVVVIFIVCYCKKDKKKQKTVESDMPIAMPTPVAENQRSSVPPPSLSQRAPSELSQSFGGEIPHLHMHPGYNRDLEGVTSAPVMRESYNTARFPVDDELDHVDSRHGLRNGGLEQRPLVGVPRNGYVGNGPYPGFDPPSYAMIMQNTQNLTPERRASLERLMKSLEIEHC